MSFVLWRRTDSVFRILFKFSLLEVPHISKKEHLINEEITVPEVRLVGEDGEQLGIVSIDTAQNLSIDKGLDLVMIAPKAAPPVCRIMDYGKFRFEQDKREKEAKKKQQTVEIKEIQLSCSIDDHDFQTKLNHAFRFLKDGNKVKASIRFRGREMAHSSMGYDVMNRFSEKLSDYGNVEKAPKLEGRSMQMFIAPKSSK